MLEFHPDYSTASPARHPAILQSSDEVCFRYDLSLLAAHSDFFKELSTVPSPSDAAAEDNLVYIPKAGSEALAFILRAVTWTSKGRPKSSSKHTAKGGKTRTSKSKATPSAKNQSTQAAAANKGEESAPKLKLGSRFDSGTSTIEEIIDTAHCYQLERPVLPVLYKSLVNDRWEPSIIFATAIISGLHVNAQHFSTRLVAGGIQGCNPWAIRVLREKALAVYEKLLSLFARWEDKFPTFKALASRTMLADNANHFGRRCTPATCLVAAEWDGEWKAFHAHILENDIYPFASRTPGLMDTPHGLQRLCTKAIPCHLCATRVAASARAAWRGVMERTDWCLVEVSGNPKNRKQVKPSTQASERM